MIFRFFISTMIFLIAPGLAFSGSINGKITYSPKVTPANCFDTGIYKNNCSIDVPNEKLLVADQGLINAVDILISPDQGDHYLGFGKTGIIKVECNLHGWMTARVIVTDNPFQNISGQVRNLPEQGSSPGANAPSMHGMKFWEVKAGP